MHAWVEHAARVAPLWLAAAWLMGLSTLGFFVVPMLFAHLPSPAIAGAMAGQLFSVQTAISVFCCAALLMLFWRTAQGRSERSARALVRWVLLGAALALTVEFVVSPHILARDNLRFWHSLGSTLYLLQWCCALLVFGRLSGARTGA